MKNENRAVFDRFSERYDFALELPLPLKPLQPEVLPDAQPIARRSLLQSLIAFATKKLRSRRNRLALLELSDDQLKDVGISRCQADSDYSRYRRSNAHSLERRCL